MFDIICDNILLVKSEELVNIFFNISKNPLQNKNASFIYFGSILLILYKSLKKSGFFSFGKAFWYQNEQTIKFCKGYGGITPF